MDRPPLPGASSLGEANGGRDDHAIKPNASAACANFRSRPQGTCEFDEWFLAAIHSAERRMVRPGASTPTECRAAYCLNGIMALASHRVRHSRWLGSARKPKGDPPKGLENDAASGIR